MYCATVRVKYIPSSLTCPSSFPYSNRLWACKSNLDSFEFSEEEQLLFNPHISIPTSHTPFQLDTNTFMESKLSTFQGTNFNLFKYKFKQALQAKKIQFLLDSPPPTNVNDDVKDSATGVKYTYACGGMQIWLVSLSSLQHSKMWI